MQKTSSPIAKRHNDRKAWACYGLMVAGVMAIKSCTVDTSKQDEVSLRFLSDAAEIKFSQADHLANLHYKIVDITAGSQTVSFTLWLHKDVPKSVSHTSSFGMFDQMSVSADPFEAEIIRDDVLVAFDGTLKVKKGLHCP